MSVIIYPYKPYNDHVPPCVFEEVESHVMCLEIGRCILHWSRLPLEPWKVSVMQDAVYHWQRSAAITPAIILMRWAFKLKDPLIICFAGLFTIQARQYAIFSVAPSFSSYCHGFHVRFIYYCVEEMFMFMCVTAGFDYDRVGWDELVL